MTYDQVKRTVLDSLPWGGPLTLGFDGGIQLTEYGEFLIGLPMTTLCECGCEKQCHGHYNDYIGLLRCSSRSHLCYQFRPE